MKLVETDDNFKNILQVMVQKEFKTTPEYIELSFDAETGYHMGVYLCLGESVHHVEACNAVPFTHSGSFEKIRPPSPRRQTIRILGSATHKIKKKAEQMACAQILDSF